MSEQIMQGISRVDPEDYERSERAAHWLCEQLGFNVWDCGTALLACNGDIAKAAEHLASGAWMHCKLVSWNWEGLRKIACLPALQGLPASLD